ncbi:hypothetical protein ACHAXT_003525 [Thalassiosira profunda]
MAPPSAAPPCAALALLALVIASSSYNVAAFASPCTSHTSYTSRAHVPQPSQSHLQIEPPTPRRGHAGGARSWIASLCMSKGTANGNRGKKRRFLQQAHPLPPPAEHPPPSNRANGAAGSPGYLAGGPNSAGSRKKLYPENARVNQNDEGKPKRRSPPLQTGKSIEELEAILERRWGTAPSVAQGSAPSGNKGRGGEEADFVMAFGDKNDYDDASSKNGENLKGAAVFRSSNRVMDPWAKEEGLYDSNNDVAKETIAKDGVAGKRDRDKEGGTGGSKKKRYNRQEAMLDRVRSNQERLQSKRTDGQGHKQSAKRGGKEDDGEYYSVPIDASKDYYDEDDEGYEGRKGQKSSLISPKPVGGRGSFAKPSSSLSGGIFSDKPTGRQRRRARDDAGDGGGRKKESPRKEEKQRPKPKEPRSKPLLDEDGSEMFLTLEQADKIVRNILDEGVDTAGMGSESGADVAGKWEDIGITDPTLLSNLRSMSCPQPLPVQDQACPPIVAGNDVLVSTHTGSGKTLAFLAPIAQSLLIDASNNKGPRPFPRAIVVAPGRELASQIVAVAQELFAGTGLGAALAIGGTPYSRNVERLRKKKPDVVVGTPGRIAELIIGRPGDKGGKLKISGLRSAVLDEFDALLQYDAHKEPTMAIMSALDRQHGSSLQKVLCSATASDMMASGENDGRGPLIEEYLRPGFAHASVDDGDLLVTSGVQVKAKGGAVTTSARVSRTTIHGTLHVPHRRLALEAVRKVLNTEPLPQQALIFVDSPRRVDIVIDKLAKMDIVAAPLHGGASSGKGDRAQVNKALREGYVGIVVATEMAARGIDAPFLTHVINLDLPTDASHYAHRAGRCGRGGRPGVAVSITCDVREKGVPRRFAEELGIEMYNVEAREGKLRIVEG